MLRHVVLKQKLQTDKRVTEYLKLNKTARFAKSLRHPRAAQQFQANLQIKLRGYIVIVRICVCLFARV